MKRLKEMLINFFEKLRDLQVRHKVFLKIIITEVHALFGEKPMIAERGNVFPHQYGTGSSAKSLSIETELNAATFSH